MPKIKNKPQIISIGIMQLGLIGALLWSIFHFEWLNIFISAVALIIVWIPPMIEKKWDKHFPIEFELLLNIFIYSSIFLGEIRGYYTKFWWWDIFLHFSTGIALGFIGFLIMYSFYESGRLKSGPFLMVLFGFCFSVSLGIMWEIFEFSMDQFFGFNMQKAMFSGYSGLHDTMWDLIADSVGAFAVSLSAYFYVKFKKPGLGIFKYFIGLFHKVEL